jgi:hypothetical protein
MRASPCKRLAALLALALALAPMPLFAAEPPAPPPPDELLVLGLRNEAGALSSWLVDAAGLKRVGDGIAVPRGDGLWRIAPVTRRTKSMTETLLAATRGGQKPSLPPVDIVEGCSIENTETLLFAGPEFFSVRVETTGDCEGSNEASSVQRTVGYGAVQSEPRLVGDLFGGDGETAFRLAAQGAHGGEERRLADCLAEADPKGIAVVRGRGGWRVRGELGHATDACRGKHDYFDVKLTPGRKQTGIEDETERWKVLSESQPGLVDLLTSPSGRLVVTLEQEKLAVALDGTVKASEPLTGVSVVHAQWSSGKAATRLRSEAPKVLAR